MYLLPGELHTAVAGTPFERAVGLYGTGGTIAVIGKTIRGDLETRDQRLFHRGGRCSSSSSTIHGAG